MIASLCADLPRHLAYIATHNRTVNTEGKPGRGKAIDQMVEVSYADICNVQKIMKGI